MPINLVSTIIYFICDYKTDFLLKIVENSEKVRRLR